MDVAEVRVVEEEEEALPALASAGGMRGRQRTDLTGVPGARRVCERASVETCAGDVIPPKIAKKATAVCTTLDRAAQSTKPKTRKKLLKKPVRAWKALVKLVGKPGAQRSLSAECVAGLKGAYGDAAIRADCAVLAP